jgi:hypothetical protein
MAVTQWQYKFVKNDLLRREWQLQANEIGKEGWELVTTFVAGSVLHAIFKKPRVDKRLAVASGGGHAQSQARGMAT